VNVARVKALIADGAMTQAGRDAFARRDPKRTAIYSFEQKTPAQLRPEESRRFKASAKAWRFFQAQAPWYQRTALHWVVTAKKEQTRARRLAKLIDDSAAQRTLAQFTRARKP
jgi:uncharacterized protein YdeI (YjbR/CyaY-like superfamily)